MNEKSWMKFVHCPQECAQGLRKPCKLGVELPLTRALNLKQSVTHETSTAQGSSFQPLVSQTPLNHQNEHLGPCFDTTGL